MRKLQIIPIVWTLAAGCAPCECPNVGQQPQVHFSPVPDQATLVITSQSNDAGSTTASCDTQEACQTLKMNVTVGTYSLAVHASGFSDQTVQATFKSKDSECCSGLVPSAVTVTLVPAPASTP